MVKMTFDDYPKYEGCAFTNHGRFHSVWSKGRTGRLWRSKTHRCWVIAGGDPEAKSDVWCIREPDHLFHYFDIADRSSPW